MLVSAGMDTSVMLAGSLTMRSRSMPSKAQLRSMGRMLRGVPFRMSYFPISSKRPLSARHLTVACAGVAYSSLDSSRSCDIPLGLAQT